MMGYEQALLDASLVSLPGMGLREGGMGRGSDGSLLLGTDAADRVVQTFLRSWASDNEGADDLLADAAAVLLAARQDWRHAAQLQAG